MTNLIHSFVCVGPRKLVLPIFLLFGLGIQAQSPSITGFSPVTAAAGATITISGDNFSTNLAGDIVYFGAVRAVVHSASTSSLTVVVPAGASAQPISVTVNGLTGYSARSFGLSFPGSGLPTSGAGFSDSAFVQSMDSLTSYGNSMVRIVDVDGDGKPDAVVLNSVGKKLYLLLNTSRVGTFSFAPKISFVTGNSPSALAFDDLDGDGRKDLLVANGGDSNFAVYRNTSSSGAASFALPQDFAAGQGPQAVLTGDFDQDGKPDVVIVNASANTISVFRNTSQPGAISFGAAATYASSNVPDAGVIADVDGDGKPDIVVVNSQGNTISFFRNTSTAGSVSFGGKVDFPVGNLPSFVAAGDVDGDGLTDLVVSYQQTAVVSVLRSIGSPGAAAFAPAKNYGVFTAAYGISLADMDGDGRLDIVSPDSYGEWVSVLRNIGSPGNPAFSDQNYFATGNSPYGVDVADMDGDGRPDIVTAEYNSGAVSVLRNEVPDPAIVSFSPLTGGNGSFVVINGVNFSGATGVTVGGVPVASYSVDSATGITIKLDTGANGAIVVTTPFGVAQRGGFIFSKIPTISSYSPAAGGHGTTVIITGTNFAGVASVAFGGIPVDSFTVLSPTVIKATVGAVGAGSLAVTVTDAAGTGVLDGFYTGPVITSFSPASGPVGATVTITGSHFGHAPGDNIVYFGAALATVTRADSSSLEVTVPAGATYQPITVTSGGLTAYSAAPFVVTFKGTNAPFAATDFVDKADSMAGNFSVDVQVGDLDGDGRTDLVITNFATPSISVLRNTGTGGAVSFAAHVDYPVGFQGLCSAIADFDGDGKLDILVAEGYSNYTFTDSFALFRNASTTGHLALAAPVNFYVGYETSFTRAVVGDFDGDGKPDVAFVGTQNVLVFRNTSTPGNLSFVSVPVAGGDYYLGDGAYCADLDRDGKPDLIIGGVFILHNTSTAGKISFSQQGPLTGNSPGFGTSGVAVGDLDNDGLPDITAVYPGNDLLSIYHNTSKNGTISFAGRSDYPLAGTTYHVAIGDLDGDGKPDVIVNTWDNPTVALLRNHSTPGNLSFSYDLPMTSHYGYDLRAVAIADLNADGKPDIIVANSSPGSGTVFINSRAGDGIPSVSIYATGSTEFCHGDSVLLHTQAVAGATYQWYKDGQPIGNANDSLYTATVSGGYSLGLSSSGDSASSPVLNVDVKIAPDAPVITVSDSLVCQGQEASLSSSSSVNNQWYRNGILLPGATDPVYRASEGGAYTVSSSAGGCASVLSQPFNVMLTALPGGVISPTAPSGFCQGDSVVLTATATIGNSYQWNVAGTPLPAGVNPSYPATVTGDYTVTVSNAGCTSISPAVTVTQIPTPAKPVISRSSAGLISSVPTGNQWYREGVSLQGDTGQVYKPVDTAYYAVAVIVNGCEGPLSDTAYYSTSDTSGTGTGTGMSPPTDSTQALRLGPNPAGNQIWVGFRYPGITGLHLVLVDINGRVAREWEQVQSGNALDLAGIPKGLYFAKFYSQDGKVHLVVKLLKE